MIREIEVGSKRWLHDEGELELVDELTRAEGRNFETAEEWLLNIGWAFYWEEQFDRAIAYFNETIRFDAQSAGAFHGRGRAHYRNGHDDRAIVDYNEAIRLDLENGELFYDRGHAHFFSGHHDQAIADYSEAIKLNPKNALAVVARAAVYQQIKQYHCAMEDYSEAIRLDPTCRLAIDGRNEAAGAKAEDHLIQVMFGARAELISDAEMPQKKLGREHAIVDEAARTPTQYQNAMASYQRGAYLDAVRTWHTLAEQGDAEAQCDLGFVYENGRGVLKDDAAALKWYRRAAEQGHPGAQLNVARMIDFMQRTPKQNAPAAVSSNRHSSVATRSIEGGQNMFNPQEWKSEHRAGLAAACVAGAGIGLCAGYSTTHLRGLGFTEWLADYSSDAVIYAAIGALVVSAAIYCYRMFSN